MLHSAQADSDTSNVVRPSAGLFGEDPQSDDPGSEDVPATPVEEQPELEGELIPHVVEDAAAEPPVIGDGDGSGGSAVESATKCTAPSNDTCQVLKGRKLKLDSWTSLAYRFPRHGRVCDILATFKYNVTILHPGVWEVAKFRGCKTAPPNGYIRWDSANVGPVTFNGNTYVNVAWTDGFGTTPKAHVHK
ncbi:hypothetical protein [Streptomyces sp. NBRC 110028]|uniref:hypothetical protein n=1 Tax=Streptomyces sp. NBRC 110028 TaxID=1621260 RepID=UPI001F1B1463|nr:hypothetical protein [Streptomyces sp. NBRC 110028]